jgi:hypothetical protein
MIPSAYTLMAKSKEKIYYGKQTSIKFSPHTKQYRTRRVETNKNNAKLFVTSSFLLNKSPSRLRCYETHTRSAALLSYPQQSAIEISILAQFFILSHAVCVKNKTQSLKPSKNVRIVFTLLHPAQHKKSHLKK